MLGGVQSRYYSLQHDISSQQTKHYQDI
jgi:hypothetical protein